MTAGERAIWAAAYIDALHKHRRPMYLDPNTGEPTMEGPPSRNGLLLAALDAAEVVRQARKTLALAATLKPKPGSETYVNEAMDMLRDMLGVDPNGAPYR